MNGLLSTEGYNSRFFMKVGVVGRFPLKNLSPEIIAVLLAPSS